MIYSDRLSPLCHWEKHAAIRKCFGASPLNVTGKRIERNESPTSQRCSPFPQPSLPFPSGTSENRWERWPRWGHRGECWSRCPCGQGSIAAGPEHPPSTSSPVAGGTSLGRAAGRGTGRDVGTCAQARGDTMAVGTALVVGLSVAIPQRHPRSSAGPSVHPLHLSRPWE